MDKKRKRQLIIALVVVVLIIIAVYIFTYYFARKDGQVIYQDAVRRIYLSDKTEYKKGREMWRMVYEDMKTGKRWYVLGNSKVGFPNKSMAELVINTVDQKQNRSFDQVQRAGVTIREAKTDIHSNLVPKKSVSDYIEFDDSEFATIL